MGGKKRATCKGKKDECFFCLVVFFIPESFTPYLMRTFNGTFMIIAHDQRNTAFFCIMLSSH